MKKYKNVLSENFQFLVVKFSVYLNRHVFVMYKISLGIIWVTLTFCLTICAKVGVTPYLSGEYKNNLVYIRIIGKKCRPRSDATTRGD